MGQNMGREGVSEGNDRLDGCVCNIRMPSVHQNRENAISGHCVLYRTGRLFSNVMPLDP